jgi:hypothetical protein
VRPRSVRLSGTYVAGISRVNKKSVEGKESGVFLASLEHTSLKKVSNYSNSVRG